MGHGYKKLPTGNENEAIEMDTISSLHSNTISPNKSENGDNDGDVIEFTQTPRESPLFVRQGLDIQVDSGFVEQTTCSFVAEVIPSLLFSASGMVAAGFLLDDVQHWPLFLNVREFVILVEPILGLKGNLEMILASRLSTAAHMGEMESDRRGELILNNLLLIQVQAIAVGLVAALLSVVMSYAIHGEISFGDAALVMATSISTLCIASGLLGSVMAGIVILSRRCNVNPDNIATPIAAMLGDLVTLSIFSGIGLGLYNVRSSQPWVSPVLLAILLIMMFPMFAWRATHDPSTVKILKDKWSWMSILVAMAISCSAGLVLDKTMEHYEGVAVFTPIMNGIGGNLGAISASRISTSLHSGNRESHGRNAFVLFCLVAPLSLIFILIVGALEAGHTSITPVFITGYLFAASIQVGVLLYVTKKLVKYIWSQKLDPDNIAIPFVTAMGDLLGTAALTICFAALWRIGDKDADVGD